MFAVTALRAPHQYTRTSFGGRSQNHLGAEGALIFRRSMENVFRIVATKGIAAAGAHLQVRCRYCPRWLQPRSGWLQRAAPFGIGMIAKASRPYRPPD